MARSFASASIQYGRTSDVPIGAYPATISAWFKASSATSAAFRAVVGGGHNLNSIHNVILGVTTAGDAFLQTQSGGSAVTIIGTDVITANVWYLLSVVFVTGSSVTLYLNTTAYAGSAVLTGWPAVVDMSIGAVDLAGNSGLFDGSIAEVGMWSTNLSAAEIGALSRGVSPNQIRRNSLAVYWPLYGINSPEIDLSSRGDKLTLTNAPPAANHAPVGRYAPQPLVSARTIQPKPNTGLRHHRFARSWFG